MKFLELSKYISLVSLVILKVCRYLLCFSMHRKVRGWMDEQNTELAEKVKEAKQKVSAAKDKVIIIMIKL